MSRTAALLFAGLLLAGCRTVPERTPEARPPAGTLTAAELGKRLGLEVVTRSPTHTTLRGRGNTVVMFPPPARWIYVNGKPEVAAAGVVRDGPRLRVPERLVGEIRARLRRPPAPVPSPPRPSPPPTSEPVPPESSPLPVLDLAGYRVVVDPGHGGKDPGAISAAGLREKAVALDVGRRAAALLRTRGAEVRMTREGDTFLTLEDRAAIANRIKAHLFVSVHADSAPRKTARGYSVYVARSASGKSLVAARAIVASLAGNGFPNRGIRRADFRVLVRTKGPAVLVELGFLSNAAEAGRLGDPAVRIKLADALARGIADALRKE